MLDSPRSVPVDYLEFKAGVMLRSRIRAGLQRVKGYGIDWLEQKGWLESVFTVCGHPVLIAMLERTITGVTTSRPARSRGHHFDAVA